MLEIKLKELTIQQAFCKIRTGIWTFDDFEEWLENEKDFAFESGILCNEKLYGKSGFCDETI